MPERVRVGIVGAGAVARCVHLPILARRSDLFELVAIADPFAEAAKLAAARFGIAREFARTEDLFASARIDAVMALHSGTHAPTVLAGLDAGVAVFSEKPLAYSAAEVDAIVAAAGERAVMVGYMKAYDPAVVAAAPHVAGVEVRSIEVVVLHPPSAAQLARSELEPLGLLSGLPPAPPSDVELLATALGSAAAVALGRTYADVVLGSISHDLAVLRALRLAVDRVDWARRWSSPGGQHSVAFEGWTAGGASVSIRWHYLPAYPAYREEVRLHHDAGSVSLTFPSPYLLRAPTELRVTVATNAGEAVTVERSPVEAFEEELVGFHEFVTAGVLPRDGIASGRADIVTAQRVVAALASGEGVALAGEASRS